MTSINNGYLLSLYGGTYDPTAANALTAAITKKAQPTAPWAAGGKTTEDNAFKIILVQRTLAAVLAEAKKG